MAQMYTFHFRKMDFVSLLTKILVEAKVYYSLFYFQGFVAVFPFASSKTREMYNAILVRIKEVVPALSANLRNVMLDFEKAAIRSIKENFPDADVSGCAFHYKQVKFV